MDNTEAELKELLHSMPYNELVKFCKLIHFVAQHRTIGMFYIRTSNQVNRFVRFMRQSVYSPFRW